MPRGIENREFVEKRNNQKKVFFELNQKLLTYVCDSDALSDVMDNTLMSFSVRLTSV